MIYKKNDKNIHLICKLKILVKHEKYINFSSLKSIHPRIKPL